MKGLEILLSNPKSETLERKRRLGAAVVTEVTSQSLK